MSTILFNQIIFGPVKSRRLGVSLGINLLPVDGKLCSFDCIYCECGLNAQGRGSGVIPSREDVRTALDKKLSEMKAENAPLDVLTFAGNGEPTIHPQFPEIIDDTIELRNKYFPEAKVAVLSNASMIHKPAVFDALLKVDNNIQKLDSVNDDYIRCVDRPQNLSFTSEKLIENLQKFNGHVIIQTMFIKGTYEGKSIDNTTAGHVNGLIDALRKIKPQSVMIYTIARETPVSSIEKVSLDELNAIAKKMKDAGFEVQVSA